MKKGAAIINSTSVTAYKGKSDLLDYSSTKGAIVAFTRSLSLQVRYIYVGFGWTGYTYIYISNPPLD